MEKSQDQPNNSKERAYNEKCDGDKDAVLEVRFASRIRNVFTGFCFVKTFSHNLFAIR
jgi:hypothetical protein